MENILECKGLSKIYKNAIALSSVNLQVAKGRIVGLLGPNGSGKTTLIKIANGLLTPTRGEMLIDGKPIGVETKKLVSYLPDRNFLAQWMTVDGMINYFADFYSDFRRERADAMLESLGIDRKRKIKTLSKGTQEKVALILVMIFSHVSAFRHRSMNFSASISIGIGQFHRYTPFLICM